MMNGHGRNRRLRTGLWGDEFPSIMDWVVFVILLLWLLFEVRWEYIIAHRRARAALYSLDEVRNYLGEKGFERDQKLLGRRGGLGTSNHAGEVDLNKAGLGGDKHDDVEDGDIDLAENMDEPSEESEYLEEEEEVYNRSKGLKRKSVGNFIAKKGKFGENVQQKWADVSTVNQVQKSNNGENRTEVGSSVNFSAVILKCADDKKWEVSRLNDENEVSGHDSAPSRRSNVQAQSLLKEDSISSSGNYSSKDSETCQKLCVQSIPDKQGLSLSEANAVDEEMKVTTEFESGRGSMRELLQEEM